MEIQELLAQVRDGQLDIDTAAGMLKGQSYQEMGYAKLDVHREARCGFPETVYCQGKALDHLVSIYLRLYEANGRVLGTRASEDQYEAVKAVIPGAEYDPLSRILSVGGNPDKLIGQIAVCTAGTADIAVAEEAARTAEFLGAKVIRYYDIGVSGIHRMLDRIDDIRNANCIIAVAGMEGALASVLGGLVSVPVIAVPTSIGYGASFGGMSALLTMINSCANGIAVVNIDNGYGAGYIASQINRLACKGDKDE